MSVVTCHISDCINWEEDVCAATAIEVNFSEENEATCSTFEEKE